MTTPATTAPPPDRADPVSRPWHVTSADEALTAIGVDRASGLSDEEVASRRAMYGRNELAAEKTEPKWRAFVRQYRDPMQIVLVVAGVVCLFLPGQLAAGILLLVLTLFNAALGMNQDGKAEASVAALKKMLATSSRWKRATSSPPTGA